MNKISTYAQYLNKIKSIDSQKIAFCLPYWMNLIWFRRFHSQLICFCTARREFAILCVIIKSLFLFITSSLTLTTFRNISWEAKSLCFSSPSNQSRWRMETTNHDRALLCWRYTFKEKTNHQHNLIKFPNLAKFSSFFMQSRTYSGILFGPSLAYEWDEMSKLWYVEIL